MGRKINKYFFCLLILAAAVFLIPQPIWAEVSPDEDNGPEGRLYLLCGFDSNLANDYQGEEIKKSPYIQILLDSGYDFSISDYQMNLNYRGQGEHYEKYSDTEDMMIQRLSLTVRPEMLPGSYYKVYYKQKIYNSDHKYDYHKLGVESWFSKRLLSRTKGTVVVKFLKLDQPDRNEFDYNAWQVNGILSYRRTSHLELSLGLGYMEKYYQGRAFEGVGFYQEGGVVYTSIYEMVKTNDYRKDSHMDFLATATLYYDWVAQAKYSFSHVDSNDFGQSYDEQNYILFVSTPLGDKYIINFYTRYRLRNFEDNVKNLFEGIEDDDIIRVGDVAHAEEELSLLRISLNKEITKALSVEFTFSRFSDGFFVADDFEKNDLKFGLKWRF